MKGRGPLLLALLALIVLVVILLQDPGANKPTVRSPLPEGYRAAFAYLEARGYEVLAWQRPLDDLESTAATLVIAAPFSRGLSEAERASLDAWLAEGGTLVLLPSGRDDAGAESLFLLDLGLAQERIADGEPVAWDEWRAWKTGRQAFRRVGGDAWPGAPERIHARRAAIRVNQPGGARTLFLDEDDAPVVFEIPRGEGRIVVVNDASVWSNALLSAPGNLALLELVAGSGPLLFDEWRQGYADPDTEGAVTAGAFEILIAHVFIVYLAAVWALGKRFGPRLVEARLLRGSVARDLRAIAALHQRGGHAKEAGALMLSRARQLARGRTGPDELPESFEGGEKELHALGRRIAELQRDGKL